MTVYMWVLDISYRQDVFCFSFTCCPCTELSPERCKTGSAVFLGRTRMSYKNPEAVATENTPEALPFT